ncbi:DNA primase [Wenjunlia tyrosinilytica]|uniref:DNA primase n=1 Tax=Wenjunlia tyrosinilytica TaxID=1544741 RepID=A0A917ZW91_9ACTN|nr:DNA primase [Wenjunlia tyrosinilytica]GGO95330.1 hypothetical protein GCM10012280_52270 [Wenjunlia tyrosinilytica]
MNNRLALALAVGGGYVLGRTKKAKLAFGLGTMVLGKRLKLNPQQLAGVLSEQLKSNPALAEIGEQLRTDLKGVGKAATGALLTRQMNNLADSLHGRTLDVRDRLGVGRGTSRNADEEREDDRKPHDDAYEARGDEEPDDGGSSARSSRERPKRPVGRRAEKKTPDKPARKAPAKKAVAKKTAAKKTAAKRAAPSKAANRRRPSDSGGGSRG